MLPCQGNWVHWKVQCFGHRVQRNEVPQALGSLGGAVPLALGSMEGALSQALGSLQAAVRQSLR